jgi:hypothetical protein
MNLYKTKAKKRRARLRHNWERKGSSEWTRQGLPQGRVAPAPICPWNPQGGPKSVKRGPFVGARVPCCFILGLKIPEILKCPDFLRGPVLWSELWSRLR